MVIGGQDAYYKVFYGNDFSMFLPLVEEPIFCYHLVLLLCL